MNRPVIFRGIRLWLTEGGALAPLNHCDEFGEIIELADSYAHLGEDNQIRRYGRVIGCKADLITDRTRGVIDVPAIQSTESHQEPNQGAQGGQK